MEGDPFCTPPPPVSSPENAHLNRAKVKFSLASNIDVSKIFICNCVYA